MFVGKVKSVCAILSHCMGDTKRGRERKGQVKQQQRREREIQRAKEMRGEELDFDELYEELEADD